MKDSKKGKQNNQRSANGSFPIFRTSIWGWHLKFIAYTEAALPVFEKAGIANALDAACVELDGTGSIDAYITACRKLRFWKREGAVSF